MRRKRVQERIKPFRPHRMLQFANRVSFNLANAFPCHFKNLPDFFQCVVVPVDKSVPQTDNLPFPFRKGRKDIFQNPAQIRTADFDHRIDLPCVFDHIAVNIFALLSDRCIERQGLTAGTEGFIEIRKYINLAADTVDGNHVYLVNGKGEQYINATGTVGFPFFGQLILDCLNRTENAMTQAHAFKAAELCLLAQEKAVRVEGL